MMKVENGDKLDRFKRNCIIFHTTDISKIHEWLFSNYNGYKFAIVFDETHDEYEPHGKETYVYFLDKVLEEVADYCGVEVIRK